MPFIHPLQSNSSLTAGARAVGRHGICDEQPSEQTRAGTKHGRSTGAHAAAAKTPRRLAIRACTVWTAMLISCCHQQMREVTRQCNALLQQASGWVMQLLIKH
jgi:hypothetical protein